MGLAPISLSTYLPLLLIHPYTVKEESKNKLKCEIIHPKSLDEKSNFLLFIPTGNMDDT